MPVVVWIHGGGYVSGSAASFDGDDLIIDSLSGGVVSVIIQYRLGLFGFLAGEEVMENGALNVGLREYTYRETHRIELDSSLAVDQTYALEWVQRYIHLFTKWSQHMRGS